MDILVIVFCVLIIVLAFYIVIRTIVRQFKGGKCAGCPSGGGCAGCGLGKKGGCASCGMKPREGEQGKIDKKE